MTAVRRSILLLTLTVALAIAGAGSTAPAQASFADSASQAVSVTTATVDAPGNVKGGLTCTTPTSTMSVTWTASPSPKVTGYQVNVTFSDGYVQSTPLAATATSWTYPISKYNVTAWSIQYSVTTQTAYGWTTESPKTGSFQC